MDSHWPFICSVSVLSIVGIFRLLCPLPYIKARIVILLSTTFLGTREFFDKVSYHLNEEILYKNVLRILYSGGLPEAPGHCADDILHV